MWKKKEDSRQKYEEQEDEKAVRCSRWRRILKIPDMNRTKATEILLLGFQNIHILNSVLFVLFLVIYILTLAGNLLIIILVAKYESLKTPMYFFLTQLSLTDILLTTNITPKAIHVIINGGSTISFTGCITQFYFFGLSAGTECYILTAMSYDRYLAICRPLHYTSIMKFRLCLHLILWSWVVPGLITFIIAPLVFALQLCGRVIDHYFCDFAPLLELSCTKHTIAELVDFVLAIPTVMIPFSFVTFTYISIILTILGISSSIGRQKAFSTCSSHLIIVCAYYGTLIAVYIAPSKGLSFNINKLLSLLYTMLSPLLNPILYSLRNQDIKTHLKMFISNSLRRN
ncbi:olfactory receptor 1013-like [Spea bombifrons]|uniref:olfactory receptor 1013-like n=1 Tax=Spea bombifrons TaxID=233779 RepID=UPI0023491155|nr:olfactory receptor 1013-like [Spea bombifrons]